MGQPVKPLTVADFSATASAFLPNLITEADWWFLLLVCRPRILVRAQVGRSSVAKDE
jgi:hypothetical protein